jgi:hypothetical protein
MGIALTPTLSPKERGRKEISPLPVEKRKKTVTRSVPSPF